MSHGDEGVDEVMFVVTEDPEGGYVARSLGAAIVTEADTVEALRERVRDAVRCHFERDGMPRLIRLHFVRDEILVA
jgi:hypothetical protein